MGLLFWHFWVPPFLILSLVCPVIPIGFTRLLYLSCLHTETDIILFICLWYSVYLFMPFWVLVIAWFVLPCVSLVPPLLMSAPLCSQCCSSHQPCCSCPVCGPLSSGVLGVPMVSPGKGSVWVLCVVVGPPCLLGYGCPQKMNALWT